MKRALILMISFVMILICTPVSAFAMETDLKFDSVSLSDDEKIGLGILSEYSDEYTKPELRENDNVTSAIRIYNLSFLSAFSSYSTIEEILSNSVNGTTFVLEDIDGTLSFFNEKMEKIKSRRYAVVDGKEVPLPAVEISEPAIDAVKNPDLIKNNVGDAVETYSIYVLSDEIDMMGTAICYRTSLGDFVYYHHYEVGELFFTLDEFVDFERSIKMELEENADLDGGISLNKIVDVSKYELKKDVTISKTIENSSVDNNIKINPYLCVFILVSILLVFMVAKKCVSKRKWRD